MRNIDSIRSAYRKHYGTWPRYLATAPGRVNLIGEHTDYNDGMVLPFAIPSSVLIAAGSGRTGAVTAISPGGRVAFSTRVSRPSRTQSWQNYLRGVVCGLGRAKLMPAGANLLIGGELPIGVGLSSSAALSVAAALALTALAGAELEPLEIALLAQGAEHEFAGTPCGIMDPYAIVLGRAGHAVLIDCRSYAHEHVPMNLIDGRLLLIDSGVRHDLAEGAYRRRVQECARAASRLAKHDRSIRTLRDVTSDMLEAWGESLDPVLQRRAWHVVSENNRVLRAVECLRSGDIQELGEWLSQSHQSLRDDFEVSCREIEEIIEVLDRHPDVLGARMIGGGFGGMVLALAIGDALASVTTCLGRSVRPPRSRPAQVLEVRPSDGAHWRIL